MASFPAEPDLSKCDNCKDFPAEFLEVDESALIDLESMPPERRLDFLVGEWELYFPFIDEENDYHYTKDQPVGFELIDWFRKDLILHAFQEWSFTSKGRMPFRSRSDFRYIEEDNRWQLTWLATNLVALYTGGYEGDGVIALYEYKLEGQRRDMKAVGGKTVVYVFRNITPTQFLAEMYESDDEGQTFKYLKWQLLYRKRIE